ncbi:MAG TPA: hypothetical protein VK400_02640 [Pyrinomonadaceae bacterium]|nr:hypothetical protein [Pyrinomonadaceae bacterium]
MSKGGETFQASVSRRHALARIFRRARSLRASTYGALLPPLAPLFSHFPAAFD